MIDLDITWFHEKIYKQVLVYNKYFQKVNFLGIKKIFLFFSSK